MMIRQIAPKILDELLFVPRAIVAVPVERLAERLGLNLVEGTDDLDDFQGLLLSLDDDLRFTLVRHRGNNPNETTVCLPVEIGKAKAIHRAFGLIAKELGIEPSLVVWRQDHDDPPRKYA